MSNDGLYKKQPPSSSRQSVSNSASMGGAAAEDEADYFAVMGLTPGASEADIRKAYRKLSLALHPDKNRHMDASMAAARFSEMQLAYEVLMDPAARLAAAERTKAETARKERRGAYEGKRKAMAEELERREEQEKQKRYKAAYEEKQRRQTLERLREEGRRLREQRDREALEQAARERKDKEASHLPQKEDTSKHVGRDASSTRDAARSPPPELGPLDQTVTLRFPSEQYKELSSLPGSDATLTAANAIDCKLARALASRFGPLDSLIFKASKKAEEKKRREASAHATFTSLESAFAAVKAGSRFDAGGPGDLAVLSDVWIGWAAASRKSTGSAELKNGSSDTGLPGEPARIAWMRRHGMLARASSAIQSTTSTSAVPQSRESDILHRLKNHKSEAVSDAQTSPAKPSAFPSFNFNPSGSKESSLSATKIPSQAPSTTPKLATFESDTLRRMREAERMRVEEAIRHAEEQP